MSSRQQQRLAKQLDGLQGAPEEEEDSESSEDCEVVTKSVFAAFGSDSDESSGDDDKEEEEVDDEEDLKKMREKRAAEAAILAESKLAFEKLKQEQEDALLEELIADAKNSLESSNGIRDMYYSCMFSISSSVKNQKPHLDLDTVMNRRFGAAAAFNAAIGRADGGGRGANNPKTSTPRRRLLFGHKEDWGKPVPFSQGGMSMSAIKGTFQEAISRYWWYLIFSGVVHYTDLVFIYHMLWYN